MNIKVLSAAIALVAALAVGWLSGSLTAETSYDSVVVGAIVPVIITSMGAIFVSQFGRIEDKSTIIAGLFVLLFCGSFWSGSVYTAASRAEAASAAIEAELGIRTDYRFRYLQWCYQAEYVINSERQQLDLPPLPSELVCSDLQ